MAITKEAEIILSKEEIKSSEDIIMKFHVKETGKKKPTVTYTITYPKKKTT